MRLRRLLLEPGTRRVAIRRRRHLRSTLAWGITLASLVLSASVLTEALRGRPNGVAAVLVVLAFTAAASGVLLNWRLSRARLLSLRDPLTGLPNRMLLDDRIEQALRRTQRSREPFTLIVVDLDGFKDVNDVRGHRAGDDVLRALARRLEAVVRGSDTVARVGGDEFVVLSTATGTEEDAEALVGRLRHALRRPFHTGGGTVEIDGSVGWAVFPYDGGTAEELLGRADGRMYATKRDAIDDTAYLRRGVDAGVVRDLETALERKEILVVYQPIIDLATGATRSAEALVRRILPGDEFVHPAEFIPHVERTPVVRELTFLVLQEALRAAESWAAEGQHLGVAVNVPYRLLDDPHFAEGVSGMIRPLDLSSTPLTLEVVPSGPGAGAKLDDDVLARYRALGVRLSLDDGGRAASFAALRVLPLDELKIDAAFVHGISRSLADAALVHGMIDIGHALGLVVVAEGVESREAWQALASWGCDFAQGFYVASPRRAEELSEWLRQSWPAVA
jgi:diguanylate cyclase (GGDEF)-like protein